MKKIFILVASLFLLLLMAQIAMGSGYVSLSGQPHGGYTDGTNKCKICHAVHIAESPYKLLRAGSTDVASACNYCHGLNGAVVSARYVVLNTAGHGPGGQTNVILPDNPDNAAYTFTNFGCVSCHALHGSGGLGSTAVIGRVLTTALTTNANLRAQPNPATVAFGGAQISLSQWCTACHGANAGPYTQAKTVAGTPAYGHDTATSPVAGQWYKTTTSSYGQAGQRWASVRSDLSGSVTQAPTCPECHAAGNLKRTDMFSTPRFSGQNAASVAFYQGTGEGSFPHSGYSNSYSLLKAGMSTVSASLDNVCNDCHYTPSLP